MESELFTLIDILGTAAFSISGVFAAMKKGLDIFGTFTTAFITAIAGGSIGDAIIGEFPVTWLRSNTYLIVIFLSAAFCLLILRRIKDYGKMLVVFDSIGLGLFTILGVHKGIEANFSAEFCIAFGTITACFCGLIRDAILNQLPQIFHKEIYAVTCIFGGILFFVLQKTILPEAVLAPICISAIVLVRLLAVKYNWSLTDIYRFNEKE